MDTWIALARGPLFRISLAICLLGLSYRLVVTLWQTVAAHRRAGDKRLPWAAIASATFQWLLPIRLWRTRRLYGLASLTFHVGIILVPLFYLGHVTLWRGSLPAIWPIMGPALSDVLTILAMIALVSILLMRLLSKASRDLSAAADIWLLVFLLMLCASGYWGAHPASAPFAPRGLLLMHMLAGNLALILTPLTKIVHCVLAPFTQLLSEVGWHFPAGSGRDVALALGKENEAI